MLMKQAFNFLPKVARDYIHDLETRCDPAGDVAMIVLLQDRNDQLIARIRALQEIERQALNLLARVHRDGGHYTGQHGIVKSFADADEVVAELHGHHSSYGRFVTLAEDPNNLGSGISLDLSESPNGTG